MTALAVGLHAAGALDGVERSSIDARFALRGTQPPPPEVVVVKIDDKTFDRLQERWPFPRSVHARLIDRLRADGARVIAYDVQFSEPTTPAQDGALLESVRRAGDVVLAATEVDRRTREPNVFGGGGILRRVRATAGNANLRPDPGGIERRIAWSVDGLPTFAVAAAERAVGHPIASGRRHGRDALIDYAGPAGTIPAYSFGDVLAGRRIGGRTPRELLRGRVVVVGATAPTLHDIHLTPTAGSGLMPGAEVQANAIATVLHGAPLRPPLSPDGDLAVTALLGLVIPIAGIGLLVGWAVLAGLAALGGYLVLVQLLFDGRGDVLPVAGPSVAVALNVVGALAAYGLVTAFDRDRARQAFARFVPEAVVSQVLAQADGARLGGVERVCTVMFFDVRGFTTYSETRRPEEVIDVLNRFLGAVTEAVLDHGGTLLTFLGDGVMALFGAPLEQPDHADRAVACARDVLGRAERLNAWMVAERLGGPFRIGIGLHTGPVVCGNVGSRRRLAYTAIGDAANAASRVEGLTKQTGRQVLVTQQTRDAMTVADDTLEPVGVFDIRGRKGRICLWGLPRAEDPAPAEAPDRAASPAVP